MRTILFTIVFFFLCTSNSIAQIYTVGVHTVFQFGDEYYLLHQSDTIWLHKHVITVRFHDTIKDSSKDHFKDEFDLELKRKTVGDYYNYLLPANGNFINTCNAIYNDPRVELFLFSFYFRLASWIPNDYDINYQWYLDKIDVFKAWDITVGSEDVIVAVIDDGLWLDHDDIGSDDGTVENVFHNSGEDVWYYSFDPDTGNGIDDDENGKIDDWKGWNFQNYTAISPFWEENNNVIPEVEWSFHGTAVSGIIAAKTNNMTDVAGIAGGNYEDEKGGIKILPIKMFDWKEDPFSGELQLVGNSDLLPEMIEYAISMEANIINMSFSTGGIGFGLFQNIEAALEDAYLNHGIFIVAAVGNAFLQNFIEFPASNQYVVAVGATDENDEVAPFSNKGDEIELAAPGVDILVLTSSTQYPDWMDGTSFATPMVAATAALMLSVNPELSNIDIRDILKNTAEKVGSNPYDANGWNKYLGYGRINTYHALCEALSMLPVITINENETWENTVFSLNDIVVESGNTLTIESNVFMGSGAKIIIKPGAKIIVNGGKITNNNICNEDNGPWQGIEVWGNSTENQLPDAQGNYDQGYLNLNNATIENALTAVNLWKPDDLSKTGGIVIANNTVFRNNARAVHAINYTNFINNPEQDVIEIDYVATFTRCSFEIDVNYPGAETFEKHVELSEVRGVKFLACDFSLISSNAINVSDVNVGIEATSAGFSVNAICTSSTIPCSSYDSCTFTGFHKAIYAKVARSTTRTFYVNRAQFHGNAYGIHVNGINNFVVLNSDFHIGFNLPELDPCDSEGRSASGYGIFLSNCTGFAIEENYFTKKAGSANWPVYIGIYASNTGEQSNEIYRNIFTSLNGANVANGYNLDLNNYLSGLAYLCNHNELNSIDFYVDYNSGIQTTQGSQSLAAGNTFSQGAAGHFINKGEIVQIGYYYCQPCDNEYPEIVDDVTREPVYSPNPCPPNYGGGGNDPKTLVLSADEKQVLELQFALALSDFNNMKALYDNLEDEGSTETKLAEVASTTSADMWERRSQLLGTSPHLSETVLRAVADKSDVYPESVIFEILAANPDELRKESLLEYLEEKDDPLPAYMVNILRQLAGGTTYKSALQQQLTNFSQIKTRAANKIIRSYLNDSIADLDALRNWLDNLGEISSDRQIIASYMQEGNFGMALSLANMLPSLYGLEGEHLEAHNKYIFMLNLQHTLHTQNRQPDELSEVEISQLEEIAFAGIDLAAVWAKNILESWYGHHFYNCLDIDCTQSYKSSAIDPGELARAYGLSITAKPNPAKHWVAFDYTLSGDETSAELIITDALGRQVEILALSGNQGQEVIDTRKYPNGTYLFTIKLDSFVKTGKFVISK